ncbi:MAG: hypothetical protein ACP5N3_03970 [Candidatus Nanoarchaeia archaeon]
MSKNILIISAYAPFNEYKLSSLVQKYEAEHTIEFAHSYAQVKTNLYKSRDNVFIFVPDLTTTQLPDERFGLSDEFIEEYKQVKPNENKSYFLAHRLVQEVRHYLHEKPHITIILDGFNETYGKSEFESAGANTFLEKPETPEAQKILLGELEKIISNN